MTPSGSGGGQGVGGPPRTGADIVHDMFAKQPVKQADAQQQASQLRQQTQNQQEQRSSIQESAEPRTQEGTGAPRDSGAAAAESNRSGGPVREEAPRETEMDSFLSRGSQQQLQREAGRTMTRQQTLTSINAQGWTVANSPNTPETARAVIQQRQQTGQGANPNQTTAQSGRMPAGSTGTSAGAMLRSGAMPTLPRTPGALPERAAPLLIQYARAYSSGGETAARAFTGRPFSPESFLQQVQRQILAQLGGNAQQFMSQQAPVAVQVRGNLVFVKDGKEFRAFRMNKDGTMTELPSEDSGEHPLSQEAQDLLNKVMRQRSLHARKEGGSLRESEKLRGSEAEAKPTEKAEHESAEAQGELDFETRFALLLHEVLEEGRELEKSLNGEDPSFPVKGDWEAFFARMMKMGNQEKGSKKAMEAVLAMVFRGLFKKEGQGNVLVGDLRFLNEAGKTKEEKFAQILLEDEKFMAMLGKLKPGQKISIEMLKEMFGDELSYTELAHLAEQLQLSQAEESAKKIVFNPKGNIDAFSQARLERSLFGNRKLSSTETAAAEAFTGGSALLDPGPQTVPANIFEFLGLRERYRGKPRLYTAIFYSVITAVLFIAIGLLVLKAF